MSATDNLSGEHAADVGRFLEIQRAYAAGTFLEFALQLMRERDMWKRRAESHGCNVVDGDKDCG